MRILGTILVCVIANGRAPTANAFTAHLDVVSANSAGALGNAGSFGAVLSVDNRFAAFSSDATNLVAGDDNGFRDVFVKDRVTGVVELISKAPGPGANGTSDVMAISADGRFVLFETLANNLLGVTISKIPTLVLHDRVAQSNALLAPAANAPILAGSMSPDARFITFKSEADNLTAVDTSSDFDFFRLDRSSGVIALVSVGKNGEGASVAGNSERAPVSADGRFVAFTTDAKLAPFDVDPFADVYRKDLVTGDVERVNKNSQGLPGVGGSSHPDMSDDGRFVLFASWSSTLVPEDNDTLEDLFVRDLDLGITSCVSVKSGSVHAPIALNRFSMSSDGRFVGFDSFSFDISANDVNNWMDSFVHDRLSSTTVAISLSEDGVTANSSSRNPQLGSPFGAVAFSSLASNLSANDTNASEDCMVLELAGFGDHGHALDGAAGPPRLSGVGPIAPGGSGVLQLASAMPHAPALLVASTSYNEVSFGGGTLVLGGNAVFLPIPIDVNGAATLPFAVPVGLQLPPAIHLQVAILDSVGIQGVALSNALVAWVPQ